jgi:GT2 family glycosyltransferase
MDRGAGQSLFQFEIRSRGRLKRVMVTKIGLVIPVHNRREITLQGLRSLRRIKKSDLDVKIFLVDDGSTDGTSEAVAAEFPDVEIIPGDGSLHYAAGTNRGISAAMEWKAEFVVTMNDDSIFHEDFLIELIETAKRNPHSVVGSLLLLWDRPHLAFQVDPRWSVFSGGWVFPQGLTAFSVAEDPFEVACLVGNCVLFPAQAIEENGLMDEKRFPHGWGDAQYTVRMRKRGWKLLVDPRSKVWCEPNTYPQPLHQLSFGDRLRTLFLNQRHPANLKRQFDAIWYSAPNRISAIGAFAFYVAGLGLKALKLRPYSENGIQRG